MKRPGGSAASGSIMPRGYLQVQRSKQLIGDGIMAKSEIRAIGEVEGRAYVVIYTERLKVRWIISAWKAGGGDLRRWQNRE